MSGILARSWLAAAECARAGVNPEIFYSRQHGDGRAGRSAAKALCRRCRVKESCLETAIELGERHGVWGGQAAWERHELRKTLRNAEQTEG